MVDPAASTARPIEAAIRRRIRVLVLVAAGMAAGVAGYRASRPPTYEAVAVIQLLPPAAIAGAVPTLAPAAFLPVITDPAIATRVVDALSLDQPPSSVSAGRFGREALRANALGDSTLFEIRVRLASPDLAARAAGLTADLGVAAVRELVRAETTTLVEALESQVDAARQADEAASAAVDEWRRTTGVDLIRGNVDALIERTGRDAERLIEQVLRSGAPADAGDGLDQEVAREDAAADALRARLARLLETENVGTDRPTTLADYYGLERTLTKLETEAAAARSAYVDASRRLAEAALDLATRAGDVRIVTAAQPPGEPIARHVWRDAILAFALTFGAGTCVVALGAWLGGAPPS
ncbi:MAG: hypothetical protein R2752_05610 [Vicinamibacterales bacterium]